ncbi:MAG: ArsR family transcriptional regulator [Methanobacteriota archaeon]
MSGSAIEIKRRLVSLVARYPGLHLRELARQAEVSEQLAGYHLNNLVADGLVEAVEESGYRRFYAASGERPRSEERETLALIRQPVPFQVLLFLLQRGSATHDEIRAETRVSKSTVTYHLSKLRDAGLVEPVEGHPGFRVSDRRRIERLIVRWRPTPDLVDRFADLWRRFYSHRR